MKSLINWKTAVAVVVILLVVGPIARQLMSRGGSEKAVDTTGPTGLARERNSDNDAKAQAVVSAGLGSMKVGKQVGKPGDRVLLTGTGFGPGEDVKVYWGVLSGPPAQTLQADQSGNIGQAS